MFINAQILKANDEEIILEWSKNKIKGVFPKNILLAASHNLSLIRKTGLKTRAVPYYFWPLRYNDQDPKFTLDIVVSKSELKNIFIVVNATGELATKENHYLTYFEIDYIAKMLLRNEAYFNVFFLSFDANEQLRLASLDELSQILKWKIESVELIMHRAISQPKSMPSGIEHNWLRTLYPCPDLSARLLIK